MNSDGTNQTRYTATSTSVSDATPAWSPDGSKIALVCQNEICVINADGTGQVTLTSNPAGDASPSWSSDGTQIAFHSDRSGDFELYVMSADGSSVVRITTSPDVDAGAAWGPLGRLAAGSRQRRSGE